MRPRASVCCRESAGSHGGPFARSSRHRLSFEELLLRHALGEELDEWQREATASGVMMIPIPSAGHLSRGLRHRRGAGGAGIDDVRITAKLDQLLLPLPEGASYLGFIFARGATRAATSTWPSAPRTPA